MNPPSLRERAEKFWEKHYPGATKEEILEFAQQERAEALEESAQSLESYMRIDKYASRIEQRGLLVNAPGIVRALKGEKK